MAFFRKKIKPEKLAFFYRQLAVMAASGVSFQESIRTLAEESEDSPMGKLITSINREMEGGDSLEKIFDMRPEYFGSIPINLLKEAQNDGRLSALLKTIAESIERTSQIRDRFYSALIYPTSIIIVAFLIICFLMVFVVPTFGVMFADLGAALPAPTRFMLNISNFFLSYWYIVLLFILAVIYVYMKEKKTVYKIASILPGICNLLKKISIVEYFMHLSGLLSFDIPLREAADLSANAVVNPVYTEKLKEMASGVSDGKDLINAMRVSGIFPKIVLQSMRVGEKSASLQTVMLETAELYEKEIFKTFPRLLNFMDICIIIILGTIVGGIIIAMYLPIFSMAGYI